MTAVRRTRARADAGAYAHKHRDSPIAKACADVGAVLVTSSVRSDIAHGVSRRGLSRAYGLGVCSASHGFAPDVHQHASGLWPELSPADYLVRWVETALQWATVHNDQVGSIDEQEAYETARLAQLDQWAAELLKGWACLVCGLDATPDPSTENGNTWSRSAPRKRWSGSSKNWSSSDDAGRSHLRGTPKRSGARTWRTWSNSFEDDDGSLYLEPMDEVSATDMEIMDRAVFLAQCAVDRHHMIADD